MITISWGQGKSLFKTSEWQSHYGGGQGMAEDPGKDGFG